MTCVAAAVAKNTKTVVVNNLANPYKIRNCPHMKKIYI